MNDKAELQRFAELLMQVVRDHAIAECDALASGRMGGSIGERWRRLVANRDTREVARQLIPDLVDEVLFRLLLALDNGDMPLYWRREDGSHVELYDLGKSEMAGWLVGSDPDCWRPRYSKQRWSQA